MSSSTLTRISLAVLLAAVPFATGCGATDEDIEAQYPSGTVGSSDDSLRGLPPGSAENSPEAIAAANDAYARGYAAGQAEQGGAPAGDGTVAIGSDDSQYSDTDPSALTDFRTTLDPYGTWVDDETYGTIWVPSQTVVGADFQPYVTAGHWVYDDDYVWVSDYEWGWVPFHYGRWIMTPRGWAWIPGRAYSGAWVSWRMGYDGYGYIGWSPLAPTWYWRGGYAYGLYYAPPEPWSFCHREHIFEPGGPRGYIAVGNEAASAQSHSRPYVPASPSVNGGRVAANPSVNGGAGIPAGSRAARGPSPESLGFTPSQVPHSTGGNAGLARARSFAAPQTAARMGAHAPTGMTNVGVNGALPSRSSLAPVATGPRYIGAPQNGPSRVPWSGNAGNQPQTFAPRPSSSFSSGSTFQGHSFDNRSSFSRPGAFNNTTSSGFAPHSSFSSSPSFHAPSSPSFHSAPSFHSSAPSFHSAAPSFHSSPSFGSSPSFHSAPSAPAYHPSSHPTFSGGGGRGRR